MRVLGFIFKKIVLFAKYAIRKYEKTKFKSLGNNVYIGNDCIFTHSTISIGSDVSIMNNCQIQSAHGQIFIGNKVMIGPGVHIHGGNHIFNQIGVYIKDTVKKKHDDGAVIIDDDCWIGSCAIILSGVKIGKGSVVGAGSVVTKSLPPYSIYTGVPELKLRERFNQSIILEHEEILSLRK